MPAKSIESKFPLGCKVRLTSKFLKSTGQFRGSAGLDRWTVTGYSRDWVITNEPADTSFYTPAELAEDPTLAFRRIASSNIEVVKTR